jgi:hypothetical protein
MDRRKEREWNRERGRNIWPHKNDVIHSKNFHEVQKNQVLIKKMLATKERLFLHELEERERK